MKIGIIGMGFVGGTTAKIFGKYHEIIPYDKFKKEYSDIKPMKDADTVFICVPTPMKKNGEADTSQIIDVMQTLNMICSDEKRPLIVIRSTVPVGTTEVVENDFKFSAVFNPEFLREKSAIEDFMNTTKIVIGVKNEEDFDLVKSIYLSSLPNAKYIMTTSREAETIKYASNVTLTGQIMVANEIYNICKALDVDYNIIKNALLLDKRIGNNIEVPGPDGDFGFGGKCFCKDLCSLINISIKNGYTPRILEQMWESNLEFRNNYDWLNIDGAVVKYDK